MHLILQAQFGAEPLRRLLGARLPPPARVSVGLRPRWRSTASARSKVAWSFCRAKRAAMTMSGRRCSKGGGSCR
ncbi:hypothetical protein GY15_15980 [Delftia sp. 670]|nr:hypothetical protein GY15_15980 [Delftia sp. 670]